MRPTTDFSTLLGMVSRAHPWHGVDPEVAGEFRGMLDAYIEMIEGDEFKRELDKRSGILRVDRARRLTSACPFPYGLIPQTYCGKRVAELCRQRSGRKRIKGDGDPLDIFVLTMHRLPAPDVLLRAHPIGGFRMIDSGQADDKIVAVHETDEWFDGLRDIRECSSAIIDKIEDYLLKYKTPPRSRRRPVRIAEIYGPQDAFRVIQASREDYVETFGTPESRLSLLADQLAEILRKR